MERGLKNILMKTNTWKGSEEGSACQGKRSANEWRLKLQRLSSCKERKVDRLGKRDVDKDVSVVIDKGMINEESLGPSDGSGINRGPSPQGPQHENLRKSGNECAPFGPLSARKGKASQRQGLFWRHLQDPNRPDRTTVTRISAWREVASLK